MMTDTEKERSLRVCGFSHLRPGPREHIKRTYGHTTQAAFDGRVWTREKVTRIELSCGHEFIGSDMLVEVGDYFDCEKCRPGPVKTRLVRRKRINRRRLCRCEGWWFPHRSGSRSDNPNFPGCLNGNKSAKKTKLIMSAKEYSPK
jgi:hypothetical protein